MPVLARYSHAPGAGKRAEAAGARGALRRRTRFDAVLLLATLRSLERMPDAASVLINWGLAKTSFRSGVEKHRIADVAPSSGYKHEVQIRTLVPHCSEGEKHLRD